MNNKVFLISFIFYCCTINILFSQTSINITGTVVNRQKAGVPDATIVINNGFSLEKTNESGKFNITVTSNDFPLKLKISSVGYKLVEHEFKSAEGVENNLEIILEDDYELGQEVVVSASRFKEKWINSPVTFQTITAKEIKLAPNSDYFGILTSKTGVDGTTSGYLFKSITTRGFNSSGNNRLNQIVDGMDNQSPGLNFSVSTICGLTEIDVENIDLLNGASSALYGSGGTNGTVIITPKNPFNNHGLSFQIKQGFNHFNSNRAGGPYPFYDWNVLWSRKVNNKFAYKIGAQYVSLTDWLASDYRNYLRLPSSNYPYGRVDPNHGTILTDPNYDGINVYGDENVGSGGAYSFDLASVLRDIISNPPADLTNQLVIPTGYLPGQTSPIPIPISIFAGLTNTPIPFARTGFTEQQVTNPESYNFKANLGLYFKLSKKTELDIVYYIGQGTSVYTGSDRFALRNFTLQQGKIELKSENWFLRTYFTAENSGKTYNITVAATYFNNLWPVSSTTDGPDVWKNLIKNITTQGGSVKWYNDGLANVVFPPIFERGGTAFGSSIFIPYFTAYNAAINAGLTPAQAYNSALQAINVPVVQMRAIEAAQAAIANYATQAQRVDLLNASRKSSDANMPNGFIYNDPRFQYLANTSIADGGAQLFENSQFRNAEFQYNFSKPLNLQKINMDWIFGATARQNYISSNGTIFADTTQPIIYYEAGAYTQVSKLFFNFWKITVSGRYDYHQNFNGRFTPRASMVFEINSNHSIRTSFQTAYRFPTNQNQFLDIKTGAGITIIGGLKFLYDKYDLINNSGYTIDSWNQYRQSFYNGSPNLDLLQKFDYKKLKPESSINYEIGYKGVILKKILLDFYAYYSQFSNFITLTNIVQSTSNNIENIALQSQFFNVPVNSETTVSSTGWGLTAEYKFAFNFSAKANLYSDFLIQLPNNYVSFYNTPKYRYNLTFANPGFFFRGKLGFFINYRWQDKTKYEGTFAVGDIPAFSTLDGAINYNLISLKSVVKLGGTNLLNRYYVNAIGNPSIGGLYYLSFGYNIF